MQYDPEITHFDATAWAIAITGLCSGMSAALAYIWWPW